MFFERNLSLVTGGTGFVGTHIAKAILAQGGRVRLNVHRRAPLLSDPRIEIVKGDLTKPDDCRAAMHGVDVVFHAAGVVAGAGVSGADAMAGIATNLQLTTQVLQAAWAAGVKRLLIFGSSTSYAASDHPVREDDMWNGEPHPAYLGYGWMRRYFERLAQFVASQSALQIALVRPSAVYGPDDDFNPATSHVIPALVRRAVARENPFTVWGTGDEVRDFLHIDDFARGCLLMMEKHAACDPVNLGYGKGVMIREIVRIILDAAEHGSADVRFDASKPTTIPVRLLDTSKAERLLGFKPHIPIEQGLADLVRWYQARPR